MAIFNSYVKLPEGIPNFQTHLMRPTTTRSIPSRRQVMRQHLGALFLRQREALCPVAVARIHVQPQGLVESSVKN